MESLVKCRRGDSLECFIAAAQGHYCPHQTPHEVTRECFDEVCSKNETHFLRGCSCHEIKEEKSE